jgi:hypothetical protein
MFLEPNSFQHINFVFGYRNYQNNVVSFTSKLTEINAHELKNVEHQYDRETPAVGFSNENNHSILNNGVEDQAMEEATRPSHKRNTFRFY